MAVVAADVVAAAQAMVEGITGSRSVAVGEAVDMVAVATEVVVDTVEEVVAEVSHYACCSITQSLSLEQNQSASLTNALSHSSLDCLSLYCSRLWRWRWRWIWWWRRLRRRQQLRGSLVRQSPHYCLVTTVYGR